jgi:hypothetical protein
MAVSADSHTVGSGTEVATNLRDNAPPATDDVDNEEE